MKIVAACAWFREPLEFLDRMARSLAGHVDELVCLDGGWYGFPDAEATSGRQERDTVRAAAREVGLSCTVRVPSRTWASQVEKRQALFDLAIKERGADWVMVVDGDVTVARCDDAALRRSLELTDRDAAMVLVRQLNKSWPYSEMPVHDSPQRHIWRGHRGLTIERAHNGIRIGGRWLHGDPAYVRVEPALDLSRIVVYDHDNMNRSPERVEAAKEYRRVRREEGLESWR